MQQAVNAGGAPNWRREKGFSREEKRREEERTEEKRNLPAIYPIGKGGLNLAYPAMLENPPRRRSAGFIAHSR
jgi:hypothetical protein